MNELKAAQKIENSQGAQVIQCPPFCSLILLCGEGVGRGRTPFILNLSTSWR